MSVCLCKTISESQAVRKGLSSSLCAVKQSCSRSLQTKEPSWVSGWVGGLAQELREEGRQHFLRVMPEDSSRKRK